MEMNTMNNGYYDQQQMYGNPYMGNPYFQGQPMYYNPQMQAPSNQNALTNEEIQRLRSLRPNTSLNLSVDQEEVLRSICTHKDNGRDVVQVVQDGSNDVWCPICGKRWNPEQLSQEEVQDLVNRLLAQMQNTKWAGEFPVNVVREFFSMMPLIEKFPEIYKYGMKNFNRLMGQNGMFNAADANIYAMYNGLFSGGGAYGYGQQYGNPYQMYGQQPNPYYSQQMAQAQQAVGGQPANPNVNPMQQPMYGMPGYNPQFGNQANMMMGGTYYQQPQMNPYGTQSQAPQAQQMYNPVFTNPVNQQPQAPQQQNTQPVATPDKNAAADSKADL